MGCYSDSPGNRNSIFLAGLVHPKPCKQELFLRKIIERNIVRQNKCFAASSAQCMIVSGKEKSISSLNLSKNINKLCLCTVFAGPLHVNFVPGSIVSGCFYIGPALLYRH